MVPANHRSHWQSPSQQTGTVKQSICSGLCQHRWSLFDWGPATRYTGPTGQRGHMSSTIVWHAWITGNLVRMGHKCTGVGQIKSHKCKQFFVNKSWSSVVIRRHGSGSTLDQIMAWCHKASSHYLVQCWPEPMLTLLARSNDNHLRAISQEIPQLPFSKIN